MQILLLKKVVPLIVAGFYVDLMLYTLGVYKDRF